MNQQNEANRPPCMDNREWVIRRALVADLDRVRAIAGKSPTAAQWTQQDYRGYVVSSFHQPLMVSKVVFVASDRLREEIAGFAAFQAVVATGECGLENMAVERDWLRRGIGTRLLAAGLLWCRGWRAEPGLASDGTESLETLSLEVRASNAAAIAFYRQAGFVERGRRRGYYSLPEEDAIQMSRTLGPRLDTRR